MTSAAKGHPPLPQHPLQPARRVHLRAHVLYAAVATHLHGRVGAAAAAALVQAQATALVVATANDASAIAGLCLRRVTNPLLQKNLHTETF